MIPRPPVMPASLAAIVTLGGLALVYWSLVGLGLLRSTTEGGSSSPSDSSPSSGHSTIGNAAAGLGGSGGIGAAAGKKASGMILP